MQKKRIIMFFIATIAGCSSFPGFPPSGASVPRLDAADFRLKKIQLSQEFKINGAVLSPSGKHVVVTYYINKEAYVQLDDTQYGPYDKPARVLFSHDESVWAFSAARKGAGIVMINGKEKELGDQSPLDIGITQIDNSHFYFDAAGNVSFTFQKGDEYYLYWNGNEYKLPGEPFGVYRNHGHLFVHCVYRYRQSMFSELITRHYMLRDAKWTDGPFDQVEFGPPSWSDDGEHFAYAFTREGEKYVNLDSKITGPLKTDNISTLLVNRDGSGFQIVYYDSDMHYFITDNDDFPGKPYTAQSPRYDKVGLPLVYNFYKTIKGKSVQYLGFGDKEFGPVEEYKAAYSTFDGRLIRSPVYSGDHTAYAFDYTQGPGKEFVVYNGEVLGPYERAFAPVMSRDGTEFGFKYDITGKGKEPDKGYFFWKEKTYGPYDHADCFVQSPDGSIGGFVYNMKGGYSGEFRDIDDVPFTLWNDRVRGGEWFFHDGNHAYGPFSEMYKAQIGYDNRSFGLVYLADHQIMVQINSRIFGPAAYDFVFAPDRENVYVTYYQEGAQVIEKVPLQETGGT